MKQTSLDTVKALGLVEMAKQMKVLYEEPDEAMQDKIKQVMKVHFMNILREHMSQDEILDMASQHMAYATRKELEKMMLACKLVTGRIEKQTMIDGIAHVASKILGREVEI